MTNTNNKIFSVIDLFCGVGGFSLGASRAGFNVAVAIDNDPIAQKAHSRNFPKTHHLNRDISQLNGKSIIKETTSELKEITGVIGGPPCQGYSLIGKRNESDLRNQLFIHFFRIISEINPLFYICENVPGIMHIKYDSIRNTAFSYIKDTYIQLEPLKLRASDYGAPTTRERIFFIGFRKELPISVSCLDFIPSPKMEYVTVEKALKGLPKKIDSSNDKNGDSWYTIRKCFNGSFSKRLYGEIPLNTGDPEAINKLQEENRVSGCIGTIHSKEVLIRYKNIKQGQRDNISKCIRLKAKGFCPTLRAGTNKDKGSYQATRPLHPYENRVITPREAARLQGFPDWYQFDKTKWHSFRQIGSSVSPILAEEILKKVYRVMINMEESHESNSTE